MVTIFPCNQQWIKICLIALDCFDKNRFFYLIFSGESESPERVREYIVNEIESAKINGLDKKMFNTIKKSTYGMMVRISNNPEAVASNLISAYMSGVEPYQSIKILSEMTYDDVQKCLIERFDTNNMTMSVIK